VNRVLGWLQWIGARIRYIRYPNDWECEIGVYWPNVHGRLQGQVERTC